MRQIQITIPNDPPENLKKVLQMLKEQLKIRYMILLKGEQNSLIIIRRKPTKVGEVVENLSQIGVGTTYGIIDILNIEATIPEYAGVERPNKKEKMSNVTERISLQEIKEIITTKSRLDLNFLIFIIIAALVAGCGLILNNTAIIIAS